MARMTRTIISIPGDEKEWLEGYGKGHRMSSAEVIRKALREFRSARGEVRPDSGSRADVARVAEEGGMYGPHGASQITDVLELRRRAIEAAGRFESGVPDLSAGHDRYLAEEPEAGGGVTDRTGQRRKPSDRPKKDGSER